MAMDADAFLEIARTALAQGDANELAHVVGERWTPVQVAGLLSHAHADVRQTAAITLGIIGDRTIACMLAAALHDTDQQVCRMVEHGLWTLWFRDGSAAAHEPFELGLSMLSAKRYADAITQFEQARAIDPEFAEASNQLALAHYLIEQWDAAIADCRMAVQKMPCHFGAIACMGHCYAEQNDLRRALACYRKAIQIHPRMLGIRDAIDRIARCIGDANDHSGQYDAVSVF